MNNESNVECGSKHFLRFGDVGYMGKKSEVVLVMMPFLGASWKEWASVIGCVNSRYCCIGVDLPGFGDAAEVRDYTVTQMVEYLADFLAELQIGPFVLVGHSMSGKVAMVAARLNATNPKKFQGLQGLVLVGSSPPRPEPMEDGKRQRMLKSLSTPGRPARHHVETYIRNNLVTKVSSAMVAELVDEVLRMNPAAWTAWLREGSEEDWSERVGILNLPTLVVAGANDKDLGPETQTNLVLPHFQRARLEVLEDCAHLVPVERPKELAELIVKFVADLERDIEAERVTFASTLAHAKYEKLINSERVSQLTRGTLIARSTADSHKCSACTFSDLEVEFPRAVAKRVLPHASLTFDPTTRLLERIERGESKGWRYAELPPAVAMHQSASATLNRIALSIGSGSFVALSGEQQDEVLGRIEFGKLEVLGGEANLAASPELTNSQMRRWFEEFRGELTGIYVSHPETLARLGYSGIADGADSDHMTGFVQLGLNEVEAWEPKTLGAEEL